MSSIARHIQVAREHGPKAGLRQYLAATSPLAADRQADILSANDKLVRYCEIFGEQIGLNGSAKASAARSEIDEGEKASLYERFLAFLRAEGEDVSDVPGATIQVVEDEPTPTRTSTRAKLVVGDEFLYHGNADTARWVIAEVNDTHYGARKNGRGKVRPWKVTTFNKLVKSGKIDL